jgi:hypothetical protein
MLQHSLALTLLAAVLLASPTGHAQLRPALGDGDADSTRGSVTDRPTLRERIFGRGSGQQEQDQRQEEVREQTEAEEEETGRLRRVIDREAEPVQRDREGRTHERFRREETEAMREWYERRDRRPMPGIADAPRDQRPTPGAAGGQRQLPPGLQRKMERGGELPPGWQRKVERGEVLSQEQVRHGRRIDDELLRRLPPQPEGTVIMETEDQVIRVLETTGEVLDVFGVGRRR